MLYLANCEAEYAGYEVGDLEKTVEAQAPSRLRRSLADLALLSATPIWGLTFVLVDGVLKLLPPLPLLSIRFGLGAIALLVVTAPRLRQINRQGLWAGLVCGLAMLAGYIFQTWGLTMTTPAKSGFITGLYVVLVPLLAIPLLHKTPGPVALLGVALATLGLALLTLGMDLTLNPGDWLTFCCALGFALQIVLISRFAVHIDALVFATVQVCVAAFGLILAWLAGLALGTDPAPSTVVSLLAGEPQALVSLLILGIVATALTTIIQVIAQRYTPATHTALIFTMEPVFAALFSYLLIGEVLSPRALVGGAFILAGMLIANLPRIPLGTRT